MVSFSAILRNVGEDKSAVPAKAVCAAISSANVHDARNRRDTHDACNVRMNDLGKVQHSPQQVRASGGMRLWLFKPAWSSYRAG